MLQVKIKLLAASFLLVLASHNVYAGRYPCASKNNRHAEKSALADPGEDAYDVKHLRFDLHVTDTSVFLWGNVTTTAEVVAPAMTKYVFELDTLMIIDSAKINGTSYAAARSGNVATITLPALSSGSIFSAQIFYHGVPPAGGGFFNGLTHAVSGGGTHMLYNVSDPWVAMVWWPCKQSATDKIDSVDMFITVPSGVVDGSNGLLVNVDKTSTPGFWQYHWQTHYPIDYYLISIAVARYAEYRSYMHFTGSTDSMLIQNFFVDTATFNPAFKANFDSIGQIVDYYSSLFGRYPFWKEKYGVCYTTLPGGMEHQTMTTIGVPNTYIIAHELMHQWFGDNVTYATWGEMWLSEGFATFSEQLFLDHFWGAAAAKTHRQNYLSNILTEPCGMVYVNDTTTSDSLFHQKSVYSKGQGVVTMLRYLAPADSLFFKALRLYQQTYALGNAGIADFSGIVSSVYGFSVDTFLRQWIYGRGFPIYKITWNQKGSDVFVQLIQTTSCPSYTTHFNTPVELQLHSPAGDTVVWAYNTADTQVFSFSWPNSISSVVLNPDVLTICRLNGLIKQDTTLGLSVISRPGIRIFPNPSKNYWQIEHLPDETGLTLTDMGGRILWRGRSNKGATIVPAADLPTGNYLLKVENSDSVKLVHW
jgi:aminopeptidase N